MSDIAIKFTGNKVELRFGQVERPAPETSSAECLPYYVYVHKDVQGNIFYVGKGRARRAWSTDRHFIWHKYVEERLGGKYTVELVSHHATEDEALIAEDRLIDSHGPQLVNWCNSGRAFDYPMIEKYHNLRNANRKFIAETKPLETTDRAKAAEQYHVALDRMYAYEAITRERGLIAEFKGTNSLGEINLIDRLSVTLERLGRHQEVVAVIDEYAKRFYVNAPVSRRRERCAKMVNRNVDA